MQEDALQKGIRDICASDKRYAIESYFFVIEALDFTLKMLDKPSKSTPERHISGRELLEGIRNYALQEYGPMAMRVLQTWRIERTEDFGELVFSLVESGKLRKTSEDSRQDFADGYDFDEAFQRPFRPTTAEPPAPAGGTLSASRGKS
ncbi:MAG: hypothetical protein OSB41_02285 [Kiritimatiellae bacterium]|nr:hypothetical protein [Kiritimatiellia bacterium]